MFKGFRINLELGPSKAEDGDCQAALLTAVALARRVFLDSRHSSLSRLVARKWISRLSYKNDVRKKQTSEQTEQRRRIVRALQGEDSRRAYGFLVFASHQTWNDCISDPGADLLDAILCCIQAAWAHCHKTALYRQVSGHLGGIDFPISPTHTLSHNSRAAGRLTSSYRGLALFSKRISGHW